MSAGDLVRALRIGRGEALGLFLVLSVASCASAGHSLELESRAPGAAAALRIPAELMKPEGPGPFPAVVMLHDCSGLGPRGSGAPRRWTSFLVERGYVVIIPDSFAPRGYPGGVCTVRRNGGINAQVRLPDAYAALRYLQGQPYVDPRRIGVMGGSHGGWSTLAAFNSELSSPYAADGKPGFAAAIALYPACGARLGGWGATRANGASGPITGTYGLYRPLGPLLILVGSADDWTPAAPCQALASAAQAQGLPVEIRVYPGAEHAFDSDRPVRYVAARNNPNKPGGCCGATTGGDHEAWADARKQVEAFFGHHLKNAGS